MTREALKIAGLAIFIFVLIFVLSYGTFFSYNMITAQRDNFAQLVEVNTKLQTQINERSCKPLLEEAGYEVTKIEDPEEK